MGGIFSAPTGLLVDAITGVVNLATSTVGTSTVTHTTPTDYVSAAPFLVLGKLVFSNVITPNGDNQNDVLRSNLSTVTNYHLQIFSGWGHRVYASRDDAQGWVNVMK